MLHRELLARLALPIALLVAPTLALAILRLLVRLRPLLPLAVVNRLALALQLRGRKLVLLHRLLLLALLLRLPHVLPRLR